MMEQYVVFKNKGLIDPRSIKTFGVSSKEGDTPIGFFGTGLKYAIAICLRNGLDVEIWRGAQKIKFGTVRADIRVDSFDIVTMDGDELGFTTELGKTWLLWQAFRELYCNSLDENGEAFLSDGPPIPDDECTFVLVKGRLMVDTFHEREKYIISDRTPLISNVHGHAYRGETSDIFYRNILASKTDAQSLYTYNIKSAIDLSEDRTIKWNFEAVRAITNIICASDNEQHLEDVLLADRTSYEGRIDYLDARYSPSDHFLRTVERLKHDRASHVNKTALALYNKINNIQDFIEPAILSDIENTQLQRAIEVLKLYGIDPTIYKIVPTDFLFKYGILGQAKNQTIYITRKAFSMGTKMVAGTIFEEFIHLSCGVEDETRAMQDALIDALMGAIETHVIKNPI